MVLDLKKGQILLLVGMSILFVLVHAQFKEHITLDHFKQVAFHLKSTAQEHYAQVLASYMIVFIVATIFFIPITALMTILGGFLFGAIHGALYACLAATIGGSLMFLIVRYFFADIICKRYAHRFGRLRNMLKKHGARYLLSLQISPVTPTFVINLLVGLTRIPLWTYIWTAFIGMLPGSLIYALAGQKLWKLATTDAIMPPLVFGILLLVSLFGLAPIFFSYFASDGQEHPMSRQ